MKPIIKVEGLGKQFRIGANPVGQETLLSVITDKIRAPFRRSGGANGHAKDELIWALKDVNFEVYPGEVVGLVGRNGAGKSTLLKILSRITEPTKGEVSITGRIGSLLEVGTGFHPELTGRENIFLNSAILGMRKAEIASKFDEIVEFSEIGKFLDTPVKRYSSGMYIRLAFSVAAHLHPEILLIDEVLAVGDISFQQKCLRKLRTLTESGMTILLVSHNMTAIQSSCSRVLFLEGGEIVESGSPVKVINAYRESQQHKGDQSAGDAQQASDAKVVITDFEMFGEDGSSSREFKFDEAIRFKINLDAKERIQSPMINFGIKRGDGVIICNFNNWYDNFKVDHIEGRCSLEGWLPPLRLVPDFYEIHALVWPWGGGHFEGDMTGSRPLAATTFGDFQITGPGLNAIDGVFQTPALKWRLSKDNNVFDFCDIDSQSIQRAFDQC